MLFQVVIGIKKQKNIKDYGYVRKLQLVTEKSLVIFFNLFNKS